MSEPPAPDPAVDTTMLANMERFIAAVGQEQAGIHSRPTAEFPEAVPHVADGGDDELAAAPWHAIGSTLGLGTGTPASEELPGRDELPIPAGSEFGRYVVLGVLGRGGMGTVLKAYDESLDRAIAIKLLHRETVTREARRLQREALALAKLSHPNVVHVYEVGRAEGRWFIAMELVRGQTLRRWQRQTHDWREIIDAYLQAGHGLAAAHAVGLVHRDFKPDNCILDESGRVRVLDFGLVHRSADSLESKPEGSGADSLESKLEGSGADSLEPKPEGSGANSARSDTAPSSSDPGSALSGSRSQRSDSGPGRSWHDIDSTRMPIVPLTTLGTLMGTPGYMALEHLELQQTDARSDQFSFCVSLYEALYDERPYEGRSLSELAEAIRQRQLRPAPKGSPVPAKLRTVLLKGLAADPEARWPSMEALLTELQRLVVPRRSRWSVALGIGIAAGLGLLGVGMAYWADMGQRCTAARAQMAGIWDDERRQAIEAAILGTPRSYAADTWARIEPQLQAYAHAWVAAHTEVCEATSVRGEQSAAAMDLRMRCLGQHRSMLRATVDVLAEADATVVDNAVGLMNGLPPLDRCNDLAWLEEQNRRIPPPGDPDVAAAVQTRRERLAEIEAMNEAGRYVEALEQIEAELPQAEALEYPPLLAEILRWRGTLRGRNGRYTEAEQDLRRAHKLAVKHRHDSVALDTAQELTFVVGYLLERHAEGLQMGEMMALPMAEQSGESTGVASSLTALGLVLTSQGEYEEAERYHQQALAIREEVLGPHHPSVATCLSSLGNVMQYQGEYEEARRHHQRALTIFEEALGSGHPRVATCQSDLGATLQTLGEYEEAKQHLLRALAIREKILGPGHPHVAHSLNNLGATLQALGEYEEAKRYLLRALAIREKALGPDHTDLAITIGNLGATYRTQGEHEEAKRHFLRALTIYEQALGPDHPQVAVALSSLGGTYGEMGEYEEAKRYLLRALAIREQALGPDHPKVAQSLHGLGTVLAARGELEEAQRHYERALAVWEKALGLELPGAGHILSGLGGVASDRGEHEQAHRYYLQALSILSNALGPDHLEVARVLSKLGGVSRDQGEYEEAERYYRRALAALDEAVGPDHPDVVDPLMGLATLALKAGDSVSARAYAERVLSIYEATAAEPRWLADTRFVLAQALWSQQSERARAHALAEQARDALAELVPDSKPTLDEVEIWLANHRVR